MAFNQRAFLDGWNTLGLNKNRSTNTIAENIERLTQQRKIAIRDLLLPVLNPVTMKSKLSNIYLNELIPGGNHVLVGAGTDDDISMLQTRIINGIDALAKSGALAKGTTTPSRSDTALPLPESPQSGGRRKRSRKSPTRRFRKRSRSSTARRLPKFRGGNQVVQEAKLRNLMWFKFGCEQKDNADIIITRNIKDFIANPPHGVDPYNELKQMKEKLKKLLDKQTMIKEFGDLSFQNFHHGMTLRFNSDTGTITTGSPEAFDMLNTRIRMVIGILEKYV